MAPVLNKPGSRGQVLARSRTRKKGAKAFGEWKPLLKRSETINSEPPFVVKLPKGGEIGIYPDYVGKDRQEALSKEIIRSGKLRVYGVQAGDEPRMHQLLHENATDNFEDEQPGYRYGGTRMKARPLKTMPCIKELSDEMEKLCRKKKDNIDTTFWNVGVNPIVYRDGRDSIGYHSDNDQGEKLILTVVVSSPVAASRKIRIKEKKDEAKKAHNGEIEVEVELCLDAGDIYSMDGEMQKHYVHSVPQDAKTVADSEETNGQNKRIVIVFRRGRQVNQLKDSGKPCLSLEPRPPLPYIFGNNIDGLQEGSLYNRVTLRNMGAHRSIERGVSGNKDEGCNAIVVSGLRSDGLGEDGLFSLTYAASSQQGSKAMLCSYNKDFPIRVFRSSDLGNDFKPPMFPKTGEGSKKSFRFDGLYSVVSNPTTQVCGDKIVSIFKLVRIQKGQSEFDNKLSNNEFLESCIQQKTMELEAKNALLENLQKQPVRVSSQLALQKIRSGHSVMKKMKKRKRHCKHLS